MDWFRMYGEFATDPKVQMLSEAHQRRYIMILCMRCSNGDVTLQDEEVAFQLRISNEEWSQTKATLIGKGLVTESNQPTAWDKRQFRSDSSAARVAAHREKKKTARNGDVTLQKQKANALDTDTDTEVNTIVGKDADALPNGFDRFWEAWPTSQRKVGKSACAKKWRSAKLDRSAEQIIAHVLAMKVTKQWLDGYDPAPLTYINQQRWMDGAPAAASSVENSSLFAGCQ